MNLVLFFFDFLTNQVGWTVNMILAWVLYWVYGHEVVSYDKHPRSIRNKQDVPSECFFSFQVLVP